MTTINYYDELESYKDGINDSTKFQIRVDVREGTCVTSTAMPIDFLPSVILAVETADASKTALSVWDRDRKHLVLIPHHNILCVGIILG